MTEQQYVTMISSRPPCVQWQADTSIKAGSIKLQVMPTFRRLVGSFEWPFACMETTISTVAEQADYTLKGLSNDCGQLINVRRGEALTLLEKYDTVRFDEYVSQGGGSKLLWIQVGEDGGFPRVKIYPTPGDAQTLTYRYWKKNLSIEKWPEEWAMVLVLAVEQDLFSSGAPFNAATEYHSSDPSWFTRVAEKALSKMISNYERGGGEDDPVPMGRAIRAQNRRRNTLHGF